MYKPTTLRKYTAQERQEALDWLKAKVRDRIPFAKGFVRFTQEQVDEITIDVHDDVNRDRLLGFLLMCWYNWTWDGGDSDGKRCTITSFRGDRKVLLHFFLPFEMALEEGYPEDFEDEHTVGDVVFMLFYGENCWPFHSREGKTSRLEVEAMKYFEREMLVRFWFAADAAQKEAIFQQGTIEYRPTPEPRLIDPDDLVDPEDIP